MLSFEQRPRSLDLDGTDDLVPDCVDNRRSITRCTLATWHVLHGVIQQLTNRLRLGRRKSPTMLITVRDNNVDQALRALKKKLQREGVYREMKLRRHYEKPSEKRARERAAAISRARKADRKRAERDA